MAAGEILRERRQTLGLSRRDLADASGITGDALGRLERDEPSARDHITAILATLDRLEAAAARRRHFPDVAAPEPATPRRRPWPVSAMGALLGFRAEGVGAGADLVAIACAAPLVVLVGASRLGIDVLAWSMATGVPADGPCYRVDVLAGGDVNAALDELISSDQLARALRAGAVIPPLKTLRLVEPAIAGRRDSGGRIEMRVLPPPAAALPLAPVEHEPALPTRKRAPRAQSMETI